jgi:hypothetical protein
LTRADQEQAGMNCTWEHGFGISAISQGGGCRLIAADRPGAGRDYDSTSITIVSGRTPSYFMASAASLDSSAR